MAHFETKRPRASGELVNVESRGKIKRERNVESGRCAWENCDVRKRLCFVSFVVREVERRMMRGSRARAVVTLFFYEIYPYTYTHIDFFFI